MSLISERPGDDPWMHDGSGTVRETISMSAIIYLQAAFLPSSGDRKLPRFLLRILFGTANDVPVGL